MSLKLSKIYEPVLLAFASMVMMIVSVSMSSACLFITYEPELPEELK
ncbi:MAG: cyclic lactone autoinducer peptide [Clostridia bacterium]|nr:cyclic lactone autoinducer peptide [Clostridia bacterium]